MPTTDTPHPELQPGEVWLTNLNLADYHRFIGWRSKRIGKVAFGTNGRPVPGLFPVFAEAAELTAAGVPLPKSPGSPPALSLGMSPLADKTATVKALNSLRPSLNYLAFQNAAEASLLSLIAKTNDGTIWLNQFLETPLWLAAERLVAQGLLGYGSIANSYRSTLSAIQSEAIRERLVAGTSDVSPAQISSLGIAVAA